VVQVQDSTSTPIIEKFLDMDKIIGYNKVTKFLEAWDMARYGTVCSAPSDPWDMPFVVQFQVEIQPIPGHWAKGALILCSSCSKYVIYPLL
jgi:hypothetical protein